MRNFILIAVKDILQSDLFHFFFRSLLYSVKIILKRKLNIDTHAALRIGVGIQMEQGFVSFYSFIDIQQCNSGRRGRQRRCGVSLYA